MEAVPEALDQFADQAEAVTQAGEAVQSHQGFDDVGGDFEILGLLGQHRGAALEDRSPIGRYGVRVGEQLAFRGPVSGAGVAHGVVVRAGTGVRSQIGARRFLTGNRGEQGDKIHDFRRRHLKPLTRKAVRAQRRGMLFQLLHLNDLGC